MILKRKMNKCGVLVRWRDHYKVTNVCGLMVTWTHPQ